MGNTPGSQGGPAPEGTWGNRNVKSSGHGGKPDDAIGFAQEGNFCSQQFTDPLDPQLAAKGVNELEWQHALSSLRQNKQVFCPSAFTDAIKHLNEDIFHPKGAHAVYAEYGKGQKAMTVYDMATIQDNLDKNIDDIAGPPAYPEGPSNATWGNRNVKSSGSGGKPDDALGYVGEGSPFGKRFNDHSLDPALARKGITVDEWDFACQMLRDNYSVFAPSKFTTAIGQLNKQIFHAKGCHAVYAEFGKGQKAMSVYDLADCPGVEVLLKK